MRYALMDSGYYRLSPPIKECQDSVSVLSATESRVVPTVDRLVRRAVTSSEN
ncbi:hypothetical protein SAMN05421752_10475 [Natronorubrum thiooxidans]|uniref:Uncharacterized protein n=1 Tax=Natronorubrum thiooxidans TaxID=308853 RepID=A0A1N7EGN9_9EURY|nr:hypothetical protein SAMN05421752_10475 [Natronorubrum thiooxidans]